MIKNIAVFCGSQFGNSDFYQQEMINLGLLLASKSIGLIYGGGSHGLMGVLAKTMLEKKAQVVGVIPKCIVHLEDPPALDEIIIVDSMHARKEHMSSLADAFILAPGGFGSLDEFFEIVTWKQINLHHKPVYILNINHYFQPLIQFIEHAINNQFIQEKHKSIFSICNQIDELNQVI